MDLDNIRRVFYLRLLYTRMYNDIDMQVHDECFSPFAFFYRYIPLHFNYRILARQVAASPQTICNFPLGVFQELRDILYLALCYLTPYELSPRRRATRRDKSRAVAAAPFLPRQGSRRAAFPHFLRFLRSSLPFHPRAAIESQTNRRHVEYICSYPRIAYSRMRRVHPASYIDNVTLL